jgi:anaphase-promoting complex subunit 4
MNAELTMFVLNRPQYTPFNFDLAEVNAAIELAARGIICANWLAATARKELQRFREFIMWIKSGASPSLCRSVFDSLLISSALLSTESVRAQNMNNDAYEYPHPKHDIPDVNAYLTSGLVASAIDKWFMGPVPRFPLTPDFGVPFVVPGCPVPESTVGADGSEEGAGAQQDVHMNSGDSRDGPGMGGKTPKLHAAIQRARAKLQEGRQGLLWPPVRRCTSSCAIAVLLRL